MRRYTKKTQGRRLKTTENRDCFVVPIPMNRNIGTPRNDNAASLPSTALRTGSLAMTLVSVALLIAGCSSEKKPVLTNWTGPAQDLPVPSGGFVLHVADQTVTCEQVIGPSLQHLQPIAQKTNFEQFQLHARPVVEQILAANIANILLLQQAKKKAGDNIDEQLNKLADAEVQRFIATYKGDVAKAEEALRNMGMDWKTFKEYQKKMMLAQSYIQSQIPTDVPIPYRDMVDYYNSTKDNFFTQQAAIQFRLIDIDIDTAKIETEDPNENSHQKAIVFANQLIEHLHNGADFAELAEKYSNDHRKLFGGLWKPVQPDSLAPPYDVLAIHARNMRPGQIAGPIESGGHIFIMKLEGKQSEAVEPFEKVQDQIEEQIKFDKRKFAADKLSSSLAEQASAAKRTEFIDFCLEEIYRVCNQ